jgi:hypothetical protein
MNMRIALIACTMLSAAFAGAQNPATPPALGTIVARLGQSESRRTQQLQIYTSRREYHLLSTGLFGRHEASMVVDVTCRGGVKDFTVISETGSRFIISHVFDKLLDSEKEASRNPARIALNSSNYDFEWVGTDNLNGRPAYVLRVKPKTGEKYLYRGKIWVDAADYAVTRIEAEPAKKPSMWIGSTMISHQYDKIGDYWLPTEDDSQSNMRLGGQADLSIRYGQYRLNGSAPLSASRFQPQAVNTQ